MKIFKSFEEWEVHEPLVATLGTFDGLHLGHQAILKDLKNLAKEHQAHSLLISLHPHPRIVLHQAQNLKLLQTLDEKIQKIKEIGLDYLFLLPFDYEISQLSAEQFLSEILFGKLNIQVLLIGYDHRFGKNREGNFELIEQIAKKFQRKVVRSKEFLFHGQKVSSTIIRNYILKGQIAEANTLLGYPFSITGQVVEGDKRGRKLGFPTANIHISDPYKIIPANGVYACKVIYQEQTYYGVTNIGTRPTFHSSKHQMEVHILDFYQEIYQQNLKVEFYEFLRMEKKFDNIHELIEQIQSDIRQAKEYFQIYSL